MMKHKVNDLLRTLEITAKQLGLKLVTGPNPEALASPLSASYNETNGQPRAVVLFAVAER